MVKPSKTRKSRSSATRRKISRRRILGFPPAIAFNKCYMDVVLRHVINYEKQPINSLVSAPLTVTSMFDGSWTDLRRVFTQVKVKRVTVYAMTGVGLNERGYHALNVSPASELDFSGKVTFAAFTSLPGTKVSRISHTLMRSWFPTSANERIWYPTTANALLVDLTYLSSAQLSSGAASSNYPLELTIDVHVRLRGVRLSASIGNPDVDMGFTQIHNP